jgi:hypothetical protein
MQARSRDRPGYLVESANEDCRGSAQAGVAVGHYEICEFFSWGEIDRQPGLASPRRSSWWFPDPSSIKLTI